MSDNDLSNLKEVYNELWNDAKNLVKDMTGSISLYTYSSFLLLVLNLYPIYQIFLWVVVIPRTFLNDWIIFNIFSYFFVIGILTFFGLKLLKTYLKLKKRYSRLWKMRLELDD
jgi:hypothetical protein